MNAIGSRMARVYRVLRRTHRVYVIPLFIAVVFAFVRGLVALCFTRRLASREPNAG